MKTTYSRAWWLGLLLWPMLLQGQVKVSGVLTDSISREPLNGATVLVQGTNIGAFTDPQGAFSLTLPDSNKTLVFSYVGYVRKSIQASGRTDWNISLVSEDTKLEEVVIVGYTTQKKENLTGAITSISAKDLEDANATSVTQALQGRTPGVNITSTSGKPGAGLSIRVRGPGSVAGNSQPLIVIDGIIATAGALQAINPQDIESVSVLKDAASASIYGARGSAGVILVKTKSGSQDGLRINFNTQLGLVVLPRRMDLMNADEYREFYRQAYETHNATYPNDPRVLPAAYSDSAWAANGNTDSDWQELIRNTPAMRQQHYLSFNGGNQTSTYMLSAALINEEGMSQNIRRDLVTIRLNSEHKVGSRIRVGENLSVALSNSRDASEQWLGAAIASPIMPVENAANIGGYQGPAPTVTGNNDRTNPVAEILLPENLRNSNTIQGRMYAELDIIEGLTFRTVFGGILFHDRQELWRPRYELEQRSNPTTSLSVRDIFSQKWQFDQILSYNRTFGAHTIGALAGHSAEKFVSNSIAANARDFEWETLRSISGGNPEFNSSTQDVAIKTNESYFASVNYDYASKYLLTASIRRDGSSRFGPQNRIGVFPAFSLGWKLNEDLFKGEQFGWLDLMKLRFGYGLNGTEPPRDFLYETFLSTQNEVVYPLGLDEQPVFGAVPLYNFGSPLLQWESAEMINFGLDLSAFNNSLAFTAEYYIKTHNDLITALPLQFVYGLSNDAQPPLVNLGDIRNSGFEFNVSYRNFQREFKWEIAANLTTIKNEVQFLPSGLIFSPGGNNVAAVGHSIGSYYGWVAEGILTEDDFLQQDGFLVQDDEGRYTPLVPVPQDLSAPGDIQFSDLNRDGLINAADRTIIGKVIPDFTYGITVDLRYKVFDLNLLLQGVQNVDLYNQYRSRAGLAAGDLTSKDENKLRMVQDYWTPENPVTDQTRIGLADFNNNTRLSTWWIEDASFLRLRNLQLGVVLPASLASRLKIGSLRFYVGGENLFVITNYSGYDPELANINPNGDLVDSGRTPVPRFYLTGLNISF